MTKPILHLIGGMHESGKTRLRHTITSNYNDPFIYDESERLLNVCKKENISYPKGLKQFLPDIQSDLNSELIEACKNNVPVIVERVLLSVKGRLRFTEMSVLSHYDKLMSFILPPRNVEEEEVFKERIKNRKNKSTFTEAGYKEAFNLLDVPNLAEGLSNVDYFDLFQNNIEYKNEFEPEEYLYLD
jgi:hypothetical protein